MGRGIVDTRKIEECKNTRHGQKNPRADSIHINLLEIIGQKWIGLSEILVFSRSKITYLIICREVTESILI